MNPRLKNPDRLTNIDAERLFSGPPNSHGLKGEWWNEEAVCELHAKWFQEAVNTNHDYSTRRFADAGIVICGGGERYFTNAYVCIRMLRHLGCKFPIELWHLGPSEMDDAMRGCLSGIPDMYIVDGKDMVKDYPVRILNGWELKPYAIIHSRFEEVLLLDADNVPVLNPAYLFNSNQYRECGAVFWPNYGRLAPTRLVWHLTGVPYRDEPEFETGQILIDKSSCWHALQVTMHMNEHSDFWYKHIHGDTDTFHLAFHATGKSYAMPPHPIAPLDSTMCQHDFDGHRIFQHRNYDKWRLDGSNKRVPGFLYEDECRQFLSELRDKLGRDSITAHNGDHELMSKLAGLYSYRRISHDHREMELLPDGKISVGSAGCEASWTARTLKGVTTIAVFGQDGSMTFTAEQKVEGRFRGEWKIHEKMPIELTRVKPKNIAEVPILKKRVVHNLALGIPTLNRYDLLGKCIESIMAGTRLPERLIIVDNGGMMPAEYPGVEIIQTSRNLGVAASWNLIRRITEPMDVILANDDVEFQPDTIQVLADCPSPMVSIKDWSLIKQCDSVWRQVGLYDEEFWPAYFEDEDYRHRLSRCGIEIAYLDGSNIPHVVNATLRAKSESGVAEHHSQFAQNRRRYIDKWGGPPGKETSVGW